LRSNEPDYALWGSLTQLKDVGTVCTNSRICSFSPELLGALERGADRHFFQSTSPTVAIAPIFLDRNFDEEIEGKKLSNHLGYEVHYRLTSQDITGDER